MKKQQLLILSLLFIVFPTLKAGDRTEQQMKEAAAKVLNTNLRRAAGNHELKEFHSLSKLKIYGYDEGGFAVVTKDDRFEDVIGYSTSKCTEEMPCGFKWWLDAANEAMENAKDQAPAKATRRSAIRRTGVSALLTSKWGQARPYNNKCKIIIAGEEYPMVTGCVATAMAQVMNYYKYPQKGKGENSYTINYDVGAYTFYSNFENSYYDWNNMLDDYSAYWYSNTENQYTDAVSKLMSDCGIAVNMKYNTSSSGTYSNLIPIALKDYFSYSFIDNTKNIYYRTNYPNSDEWMNMVYNALNNNHPIIYCGSKGGGGHCFVIHGYEPDGKVIVNWGWNGSYDGSFLIDMLNPGLYSFNDNQNMVIPIPEEKPVVTNTYKLTYLVDGEIYKEYELKAGDIITPEPAPTKEGYTFSGWSNIPSTMPNHDVAVTGYFYDSLPSVNTVTVEINGIYYILIGKSGTAEVTSSPNKYSGSVTIPESVEYEGFTYQVTRIGEKAFDFCQSLSSISIPGSVTGIGDYAFSGCSSLPSIILPASIMEIGQAAFSYCSKLSSIDIPEGVSILRYGTFDGCSELKSITIPNTVTSIQGSVFYECLALESISLPSNLTTLGACFYKCESLSSIVIPDKVNFIYASTFYGCKNLKSVTVGKSVTNIYGKAFAECKSLESFVCMAENPPTANADAFESSYIEYVNLYVPDASVNSYLSATPWNKFGTVKGISEYNPGGQQPPSLTTEINGIYYILIGKSRTAEVTSSPNKYSGSITIPESVEYEGFTYQVTRIGEKAFNLCQSLSSISIPGSVTGIGDYAFSGCSSLPSIILPASIMEIGQAAFSYCSKLSSIDIPEGVSILRYGTFDGCSELKSITIPNTVTSIQGSVFYECLALESISLPSNLTTLGACFYKCESLSSIVIPDKVNIIYASTFDGCKNLKSVTVGKSVTSILSKAFAECKSLESFVCMAENPPTANADVFEGSYIEYVNLYVPDASVNSYLSATPWNKFGTVKGISEYNPGGQQPPSLTTEINGIYYILIGKSRTAEVTSSPNKYSGSITIPESVEYEGFTYQVTRIGEKAFNLCQSLSSISIPGSVTGIGDYAFSGCSSLPSIILPASIMEIGQAAFSYCSKLSSIDIPEGVSILRYGTFDGCSELKSITIPNTVTSIQGSVFYECLALESISLPSNLTTLGACFYKCESLSSIVIPDKVNIIYASTFDGCKNLKSVTVGKSVTSILSKAFAECKSLESFVCMAENPPTANADVFEGSYIEYVNLYVPENSVNKYKSQDPWSKFGQIVAFSGNIKYDLTYKVDGEVYKSYQLEAGATITPEPEPTKDGYKFSGWSEIPATMPAHNVTVTGTFERVYNVGDIVSVVNFIMNANATANDIALYDMNGDGELNIGDVILIVKSILNNGGVAASPAFRRADGIVDFTQYTAAQFELKVDKNVSIKDIRLVNSMSQSHQLMYQQKDDNTYAVVVYSLSNQLMNSENGRIVDVEADGGKVTMQNITVATQTGETHYYQSYGTPTGVYHLEKDSNSAVIFDLKGNRLDGKELKKGIYIINGKKAVVK